MQQINFYLLLNRPSKYAVNFAKLWRISLAVVILLALASAGQYGYKSYEQHRLISLQNQLVKLTQKKQELIDHSKNIKAVRALEQEIADATDVITKRNLMKQKVEQNISYSLYSYLNGFAQATTPGVWLNEINIQNKGKQITLKGGVVNPILLPKYVTSLEGQTIFTNITFTGFKVAHESDAAYAEFTLSSL